LHMGGSCAVQCKAHRQVGIARSSKEGRAGGPARRSASDAVAAAVAHLHDQGTRQHDTQGWLAFHGALGGARGRR
jgi:hypothetical protein